MNIFEIPVREFVSSLCFLRLFIVDAKMPPRVGIEAILADELILVGRGRLVLTPSVPFIGYEATVVYELFGVVESFSV